jgi:hypothetical protein
MSQQQSPYPLQAGTLLVEGAIKTYVVSQRTLGRTAWMRLMQECLTCLGIC